MANATQAAGAMHTTHSQAIPPMERMTPQQRNAMKLAHQQFERDQAELQRPTLPPSLANYVKDFAAEFHDEAMKSSLTRVAKAHNVAQQCEITQQQFAELLYEARRRTQRAVIKRRTHDGKHFNRMPYFLETLDYCVEYLRLGYLFQSDNANNEYDDRG